MLDKNQLNELAAMQRRYAEIYNSTGLAGFDKCYVHLSSKEFLETFNEFGTIDKNCEDYPVELYAVHLGVKFMCLLEKEEATTTTGRAGRRIPAEKENEMLKDTDMSAAALYDGGWRADDKEQLIEEYDLTDAEADAICGKLAEYAGDIKGYQVIEDNGGGVTLAIYNNSNKVVYLHTGYEYVEGQLDEDIAALKAGENPLSWDSNSDDPQGDYDRILSYEYGWDITQDELL